MTVAVLNKSGELIPAYGAMAIRQNEDAEEKPSDVDTEQVVWHAYKPSEAEEYSQNTSAIIFNGTTPIPIGAAGQGEFAVNRCPLQALHDETNDGTILDGDPCGVKRDSWFLWQGFGAFVCLSDDPAKAVDTAQSIHTIWIAPPPPTSGVRIRNDSGADLEIYGVLGVDGVIADPDQASMSNPKLYGSTPDFDDDHVGNFAVLLEPCENGKFARCAISGSVVAKVDIKNANHLWCDVEDGVDANLKSYEQASARILHKESGTGVKWCMINIAQSYGPATMYRGRQVGELFAVDPDNEIDDLVAMDGVPVETGTVTASNLMGWAADDNALTYIQSKTFGAFEMIQVACPAE